MIDPIVLATVTSSLAVLGSEVAKGVASGAGKDLWAKAKSLLGWESEPPPKDFAISVATQLQNDEALGAKLITLLQEADSANVPAAALVGRIDAKKVVVIGRMEVSGDFRM